jgi:tripartite-type tricarboxylate transporter receptor subunit TctC
MARSIAFLVASMLVAAACGGAPSPAATGAPTAAPAAATAAPTQDPAKAVADFYSGKTIRIIVGFEAGGGFDTTSRILARYLGKYIPGTPTVVVENMPGAGSTVAANHLYKVAKPDGLTIGVFNEQQVMQQALGNPAIEFEATKFSWLGSAFSSTIACIANVDAGFKKVEDLIGAAKPFIVGTTGPGANTHEFPQVLRAAIGGNVKLVSGYDGTSGISRAVSSGEVQGGCWTWESMKVTQGKDIEAGKRIILVQQGTEPHPDLKNVPQATDVAKTAEGKQMLKAIIAPGVISKPYTAPPGVPAERLGALRDAYLKAMKDPALLEEAKKAKLDLDIKDGEKVATIVKELLGTDKAVLEQLKKVLATKE